MKVHLSKRYCAPLAQAISRLLDQALRMDAKARQTWLDALPAEHAALMPVLRQMLDRAKTSSSLLLDRLPRLNEALHERFTRTLKAGDRVGPYELVRELGSGGMAEVWPARRAAPTAPASWRWR